MIIAPSNFRDEELFGTKEVLEKNGLTVTIGSTVKGDVTGMLGGKTNSELTINEVNLKNYKAVVFIGGSGVIENKLYDNPEILELAKKTKESNKVIGAICAAPMILAKAKLLEGKRATVFKSDDGINMLSKNGAIYTGSSVEVDGKIVTADGPTSARDFGEKIVEVLS